jgi:hypothetical protein
MTLRLPVQLGLGGTQVANMRVGEVAEMRCR